MAKRLPRAKDAEMNVVTPTAMFLCYEAVQSLMSRVGAACTLPEAAGVAKNFNDHYFNDTYLRWQAAHSTVAARREKCLSNVRKGARIRACVAGAKSVTEAPGGVLVDAKLVNTRRAAVYIAVWQMFETSLSIPAFFNPPLEYYKALQAAWAPEMLWVKANQLDDAFKVLSTTPVKRLRLSAPAALSNPPPD